MKRETKEQILKAVSALKNYFTVQEKALTAKREKNIPSVEVKDAQTETMPEENLSYTAEQVATSRGRKQKPTRSNQHILPPMQQWMEEVERNLQKKAQEEIQTAI